MQDFPEMRQKLFNKAMNDNRYLIRSRYAILAKYPLYGIKGLQKKAM
jgi:hypothetical protein